MRNLPRHILALALSTVTHGVLTVWSELSLATELPLPEFEFELAEVELIDPDLLQGEEPQPEPPPAEPPVVEPAAAPPSDAPVEESAEDKAKREEEERKKKEEEERKKKEAEAAKRFAAKSTTADQLAPPTSTFHLLLVPAKIRKLPFATTAFEMLQPWPDFDFLVRKGGLDPLADFDHIVIASPDIRDPTQTFLAVDYKSDKDSLRTAIERAVAESGEVVEWIDQDGFMRGNPRPADPEAEDEDSRWFVFHPTKKVAFFVRREFLEAVLDDEGDDGRKTSGNFVKNLTRMKTFAARQPGSGMQLKIADIHRAMRRAKLPFPVPDTLEISVEAALEPELLIRVSFGKLVDAKAFENWYVDKLGEFLDGMRYRYTVKPYYDLAELERDDSVVTVRAEFTQAQIELVLGSLADYSRKLTEQADRKRREREQADSGDAEAQPGDDRWPAPAPTDDRPGASPRRPAAGDPGSEPPPPPTDPLPP